MRTSRAPGSGAQAAFSSLSVIDKAINRASEDFSTENDDEASRSWYET